MELPTEASSIQTIAWQLYYLLFPNPRIGIGIMEVSSPSIAAFAVAAMNAIPVTAQNMSFGADNFYQSEFITVQPITFQNQFNMTVAANLFMRNNLTRNIPGPAIVVSHPMGAVKEQSANLYATKLAEQGFITVSIDMPFWGGSEGEPRNAVLPDLYPEAFSAAVDYLGTQDFVDRERIGGLGICGSGSFVIGAAKIDPRLKVIATSSMYDMGSAARNGLRHSQKLAQRKAAIAQAAQQRWVEAEGGETEYTGETPNELTPETDAIGREFYDFYRTWRAEVTPEGATPNLTTHPTLSSTTRLMNFYPFNDIETISPRPLLFISGDQAHSREFSEDAYARAADPKELYWVPRAGHVDLYDRTGLIPFDKLTDFFRTNLARNGTSIPRGGSGHRAN